MAVKLRLMRMGKKKQPTYRVVAADSRKARNGRFIEALGFYDPRRDPSVIEIDNDKAVAWLRNGAQPTERVEKLLKISGAWTDFSGEQVDATPPAPSPVVVPVAKGGSCRRGRRGARRRGGSCRGSPRSPSPRRLLSKRSPRSPSPKRLLSKRSPRSPSPKRLLSKRSPRSPSPRRPPVEEVAEEPVAEEAPVEEVAEEPVAEEAPVEEEEKA